MTYSKISVFVLLAVIAASLAACTIEPSIDDYDIYVMVKGIDEETHNPVAKIYKNNVFPDLYTLSYGEATHNYFILLKK